MPDLSKRANLKGVREVRGLVLPSLDTSFTPTQVVESEWAPMVRSDVESEDAEFWRFVGQASIVGHPYTVRDMFGEFQETIMPGAWDKTLSENPDVMYNYMHEPLTTMATTRGGNLSLAADPHFDVKALVPRSDVDGQRFMPKVQRGDASSMSFAFRVGGQVWNEDYTDRKITEIIMHRGDVASIVSGFGANPPAWGTVRSDGLDDAFRELRAGTASPEQVQQLAELVSSSIDMADDAFDVFLSALGIPDPDAAEDIAEEAAEQNSALGEFYDQLFAVRAREN